MTTIDPTEIVEKIYAEGGRLSPAEERQLNTYQDKFEKHALMEIAAALLGEHLEEFCRKNITVTDAHQVTRESLELTELAPSAVDLTTYLTDHHHGDERIDLLGREIAITDQEAAKRLIAELSYFLKEGK